MTGNPNDPLAHEEQQTHEGLMERLRDDWERFAEAGPAAKRVAALDPSCLDVPQDEQDRIDAEEREDTDYDDE